jgi:hypothetical protein
MQGVILFVFERIMAITLEFCTVLVYFIQRVYLRSSRQLRFIDLDSKSQLYASFIDTVRIVSQTRFQAKELISVQIDGIATIGHSDGKLHSKSTTSKNWTFRRVQCIFSCVYKDGSMWCWTFQSQ